MNMSKHKQEGAVLVIGLILLVVMTLIGVSGMGTTTSQLKMANNLQTHQVAFQATETVAAYFQDLAPKDASPYVIDWDTRVLQQFSNINPVGDGKSRTNLDVVYVDCTIVPMNQGLTGDSQDGESGGFKGVVHDLVIVSSALNSDGFPVGQKNDRVNGVQTIAPGCP